MEAVLELQQQVLALCLVVLQRHGRNHGRAHGVTSLQVPHGGFDVYERGAADSTGECRMLDEIPHWSHGRALLIIMVVSLQIIYRLGTCDNQLSLIDMRANPFDSSADIPVGENRPRNHKLVVRSTHHDNVLLLVKMVCTSSTVYFANQNFASVVYIFAACALLFADFSVDMYWDVTLRGMNPSCLQAGFDFGLLWLYLVTLAADLALEGAQSTARTIFFLVSILPVGVAGYRLKRKYLGNPPLEKLLRRASAKTPFQKLDKKASAREPGVDEKVPLLDEI